MNYITKANIIHRNKYDYSKCEKITSKSKITVICKNHGEFIVRADHHLNNQGCSKCKAEEITKKHKNNFIKKAKLIHGDKYDYSLVDYKNSKTEVIIICKIHGEFKQKPYIHLRNHGCQKCGYNLSNTEKFIEKANKKHSNKYNYKLVNYTHSHNKINIICEKHGIFSQSPEGHLSGRGCPLCRVSKGEKQIESFLLHYNIRYEYQKKFNDCVDKRELPFDFYLIDYNMIIEYDGIQHFELITYFGETAFQQIQLHDKIKNQYCYDNNIDLIRIKYNDNISEILKKLLNKLKITN